VAGRPATGGRFPSQPGPLATLALEHALVLGDDDLEPGTRVVSASRIVPITSAMR